MPTIKVKPVEATVQLDSTMQDLIDERVKAGINSFTKDSVVNMIKEELSRGDWYRNGQMIELLKQSVQEQLIDSVAYDPNFQSQTAELVKDFVREGIEDSIDHQTIVNEYLKRNKEIKNEDIASALMNSGRFRTMVNMEVSEFMRNFLDNHDMQSELDLAIDKKSALIADAAVQQIANLFRKAKDV
jgi:hypothetical protein